MVGVLLGVVTGVWLLTNNDEPSSETAATSVTTTTLAPTTTSTSTTTVTPTTTVPSADLTLRPDGLGVVDFGTPIEDALAVLSATNLGPSYPVDGGLDGPEPGTCPQPVAFLRLSPLLYVGRDGSFIGYTYQGPASVGLTTSEGIGYGATLDDILGAYGSDRVTVSAAGGDAYAISTDTGDLRMHLVDSFGVTFIGAGRPCL